MLPCGCNLDNLMRLPSEQGLMTLSGKTLRNYANAHNIGPTGTSGIGHSRWRNAANATELRAALLAHLKGEVLTDAPGTSVEIPGAEYLPQLLDRIEDLLTMSNPDDMREFITKLISLEVNKVREQVQQVELIDPGTGTSFGTVDGQHKEFTKLLQMVRTGVNILVVGPAGSGKTEAALEVCRRLDRPFELISVGPQTMQSELMGYRNVNGDYIESAARRAYEQGKLLIIDEFDAGNGGVFTVLNAALGNARAGFPDGPIKRGNGFGVIALANTFGTGADMVYVGRSQMDGATLDRYATLIWDYDESFERMLAKMHNPECDNWVTKVQHWRANMMKHKLRHVISPRASIMGAKLLKAGFSEKELEPILVFKGLNKEACDKIRQGQ